MSFNSIVLNKGVLFVNSDPSVAHNQIAVKYGNSKVTIVIEVNQNSSSFASSDINAIYIYTNSTSNIVISDDGLRKITLVYPQIKNYKNNNYTNEAFGTSPYSPDVIPTYSPTIPPRNSPYNEDGLANKK